MTDSNLGRRRFIQSSGVITAGAVMALGATASAQDKKEEDEPRVVPAPVAVAGGWESQKPIDPDRLTEGEARHFPVITVEGNHVRIHCKHPMLPDHHVQKIVLWCGDRELGTAHFLPEITEPDVTFVLVNAGEYHLRAALHCNRNGVFVTETKLEIEAV